MSTGAQMAVVPEEFRAIGYSGSFQVESTLVDASPGELDLWEAKVPCLLPTPGWMALSVNREAGTLTVIRRDSNAIVEAYGSGRARRAT